MNTVQTFIQRQMGLALPRNYDIALSRLCVHVSDNWRGLSSSITDGEYAQIPPIYSAKFANTANAEHLLALANEDGKIAIHDTERVPFDEEARGFQLPGYQCHNNAVCDIAWMPGEMKLVSASSDSKSCLWEVCNTALVHSRTFSGHTRSVKTVSFRHEDSSVFATGGRDGAILIWDTRVSPSVDHIRADNCIFSGHAELCENRLKKSHIVANACKSSITGLGFQDENTLISCGAGDGVVKVWDLRRNYTAYKREPLPKHSLPYRGISTFKGFTNLVIDPKRYRLYVSCMDNTIYCYNIASYDREPLQKYIGFKNSSYYIRACLSPDGQYLLSGSSDEKAYLWNVDNPRPVATLSGDETYSSSQEVEVSCVAWSQSRDMCLVTCSDDARHKIWRIGPTETDPLSRTYRGFAHMNPDYGKRLKKSAKGTPKTWWSNGDCTPSSSGRVAQKRTFAELDDDYGESRFGDSKRPHIEPRGRRLFPISATTDPENPPHELKSPVKSPTKSSPLSERVNVMTSPETPSTSHVAVPLFSPTSNLPNYVMDGEAPHLRVISPKRKLKENVDWLTKIRKQKLQQVASSLTLTCDGGSSPRPSSPAPGPMSPRIQSLRDGDATSPQSGTPRRRTSRSNSTSDRPKTPSTRQPTESILRFLTPTSSTTGHSSGHK